MTEDTVGSQGQRLSHEIRREIFPPDLILDLAVALAFAHQLQNAGSLAHQLSVVAGVTTADPFHFVLVFCCGFQMRLC